MQEAPKGYVESYSGVSVTLKSMLNNVGKKSVIVFSSFQKRHALHNNWYLLSFEIIQFLPFLTFAFKENLKDLN